MVEGGEDMQKTIYLPDNKIAEGIVERVEFLMKEYSVSFSEIVFQALRDFVSVARPKVKKEDFRNAKLANIRG
jgi:hypothetical protein